MTIKLSRAALLRQFIGRDPTEKELEAYDRHGGPAYYEDPEELREKIAVLESALRKMEYVPFADGTFGPAISWPNKSEVDAALGRKLP